MTPYLRRDEIIKLLQYTRNGAVGNYRATLHGWKASINTDKTLKELYMGEEGKRLSNILTRRKFNRLDEELRARHRRLLFLVGEG